MGGFPMRAPTPYGHDDRMSTSLQILASEQHLADLHRAGAERERRGRLARRAERARRARGRAVRQGRRVLRPV